MGWGTEGFGHTRPAFDWLENFLILCLSVKNTSYLQAIRRKNQILDAGHGYIWLLTPRSPDRKIHNTVDFFTITPFLYEGFGNIPPRSEFKASYVEQQRIQVFLMALPNMVLYGTMANSILFVNPIYL